MHFYVLSSGRPFIQTVRSLGISSIPKPGLILGWKMKRHCFVVTNVLSQIGILTGLSVISLMEKGIMLIVALVKKKEQ